MTDVLRGRLTTLYAAMKTDTLPPGEIRFVDESLSDTARLDLAADDCSGNQVATARPILGLLTR